MDIYREGFRNIFWVQVVHKQFLAILIRLFLGNLEKTENKGQFEKASFKANFMYVIHKFLLWFSRRVCRTS